MAFRVLAKFDEQTIRASLYHGRNIIGSDPSCHICLPNSTVSRRHAVISVTAEGVELEDLGSTNGTMVRSRRIERSPLLAGEIFVIGRVVVRLEEVAQDDLEVGVTLPRELTEPSGVIQAEFGEVTDTFHPLDRFTLDHLPRLLDLLCGDVDRPRLAQKVGFALFETLPVTSVEVVETGSDERGVLYAAERAEGDDNGVWVEAATPGYQVRARFFGATAGDHYRPVVHAALSLLYLADREHHPAKLATFQPGHAERPQPVTVEPEVGAIYDQAERVARGDVGVLITGESGTGKEVLARFIHGTSPRATQPLVVINCASLPRDLLEAELFGVEKGVATGVEARPGKFETADQGTLFLDEIGDMAAETQAKILRVLQEREVFRLGGHTPRAARARVIAATNRSIRAMLGEGTFRTDLYHRIATWEVELPPLRRRRADISNLAVYFLSREAQRYGIRVRGISRAALRLMRRYRWPGNIRQLKNEISRGVLFLENGELLDTARLSPVIRGEQPAELDASLQAVLESVEREEITAVLEAAGGDTAITAERLQISRPTLYRRLKSLGIKVPGSTAAKAG